MVACISLPPPLPAQPSLCPRHAASLYLLLLLLVSRASEHSLSLLVRRHFLSFSALFLLRYFRFIPETFPICSSSSLRGWWWWWWFGGGEGGRESSSRCFFPRQQREVSHARLDTIWSPVLDEELCDPYFLDENKFGGIDAWKEGLKKRGCGLELIFVPFFRSRSFFLFLSFACGWRMFSRDMRFRMQNGAGDRIRLRRLKREG